MAKDKKVKVLLAEDHALVRDGTVGLFKHEPDIEIVGEAGDGEEAVALATKLQPDVVIMDISMPKLNGIEATKQIKAHHPDIAILILTAYDNDEYIFSLLDAGAAGYLLKNVRGHELVEAVRSVYAGESVLHPAIARRVINRLTGSSVESVREVETLSDREMEVLKLAARGISNKDIAERLFLSPRTVQVHLGNIFNKLGVASRTEAVLYALKRSWFSLEDLP